MTQSHNSAAPSDALLARYHAAQATLDTPSPASEGNAAQPALPSAQVRANILAHAAQVAQGRGAHLSTQDATDSGAAHANKLRAGAPFDHQPSAANDSRWTIRALASVAVLGLTSLLFLQWDRGTPEEKEVAFGMERPAPAPAPAAPAPAPAPAAPATTADAVAAPAQNAKAAAAPAPASVAPPARSAAPKSTPTEPPRGTAQASASAPKADSASPSAVQAAPPLPALAEAAPRAEAVPAPASTPAPMAAAQDAGAPAIAPPAPSSPAYAAAPPATVPTATGQAARARAPLSLPDSPSAEKALGAAAQANASAAPARLMSPNAALFAAIREADTASLQLALARGADKNAKSNGTPAITLCVQSNQLALVRILAAAGTDVNATDAQGMSPLAHANAKGLDEMVKALLELGAK